MEENSIPREESPGKLLPLQTGNQNKDTDMSATQQQFDFRYKLANLLFKYNATIVAEVDVEPGSLNELGINIKMQANNNTMVDSYEEDITYEKLMQRIHGR